MKKEIFKVCALGLVSVVLVTGCQTKEGNVKKITKNEEISYDEKVSVDDNNYYGIEYYKYLDNKELMTLYENDKKGYLGAYNVTKVTPITKEDNIYEAIITTEDSIDVYYEYLLLVKNDKEYINLFHQSTSKNQDEIIAVGNELKERLKKSNDFGKIFEEFSKEKKLNVEKSFGEIYSDDIIESKVATNLSEKEYTTTDKKVDNVKLNIYSLSINTIKIMIEAKTKDGEIVWSMDLGISTINRGFEGFIADQVGDLFLLSNGEGIEARDIQTGKVLWTEDITPAVSHNIVRVNNKIVDMQGEPESINIEVKDSSTGKTIHTENNIDKYIGNENYMIYSQKYTIDNDTIIYNVVDTNTLEQKNVGKLKVNTNTYKIVFER